MGRVYEALEKSKNLHYRAVGNNFLRFYDLASEIRDQFEKLKSSTILGNGHSIQSILFVSYNQKEGTSTMVANYAESLAQDRTHNILLVDGNTRNPSLHKRFNLNSGPGFYEILLKKNEIEETIQETSTPNLSLIPSGNSTYHPSQIFDQGQFKHFLEAVKERYDCIIFDSSPIGKHNDSLILGAYLDAVILVIQAERTPWYEVKRAEKMLVDRKVNLLGTILNRRKYYIPNSIFTRFFT